MVASVLKLLLCIFLLDYISTNSLCMDENNVTSFTGGYQHYENLGYYKLYSLSATWPKAWRQCRLDGAHLVVIDSDEEHEIVWNMLEQYDAEAFIGVHDFFYEGVYFTITGHPFVPSSYNRWRGNQPGYYNNGDCVLMGKDGELSDENCNNNHWFICEFELK